MIFERHVATATVCVCSEEIRVEKGASEREPTLATESTTFVFN